MKKIKPFPQKCIIVNEIQKIERNKSNAAITGYKVFNEKSLCI